MNTLESTIPNGSMPISMAVDPKLASETEAVMPGPKKDLDYFRREGEKVVIGWYRSKAKLADFILDARINLSPDDFNMLISELQFDYSTVCKLIKQAADYRLNDPKNQALIPEKWTLRHEIMMMKEETFRIGVTKGIIHSGCPSVPI